MWPGGPVITQRRRSEVPAGYEAFVGAGSPE
jgi:hypothetical protein